MDRRALLQFGASAIAAGSLAQNAFAQAAPVKKLKLDAYSRTLHWLRTPEEVAKACREIGNTTIDLTVRVYPGHVDPAKVKTDLPPFVNGLKRNGVTVTCMAAEIADANTPNAEAMLDTASSLGVHTHWWRGYSYDPARPYNVQIDELKKRTEGLAKLNEKYGMKALYHPTGFGTGFVDLLDVVRNFDPRYISIHYDSGNFGQINQSALVTHLRAAAPYIGAFVFKDFVPEKVVPGAVGAGPGGPGGGPGGNNPPNAWRTRQVPVGTGVINLALIAKTLKEIKFDGPMECQPEWPELGGANQGLDKLTISRAECIALLKRDRVTVEASLAAEGLI